MLDPFISGFIIHSTLLCVPMAHVFLLLDMSIPVQVCATVSSSTHRLMGIWVVVSSWILPESYRERSCKKKKDSGPG